MPGDGVWRTCEDIATVVKGPCSLIKEKVAFPFSIPSSSEKSVGQWVRQSDKIC